MIKVVTFDLDDTLWAAGPVLAAAETTLYRWLQRYCPAVTRAFSQQAMQRLRMELIATNPALRHQITRARECALLTAMLQAGITEPAARQQTTAAMAVFLEARHDVTLFEEVEESVAELHRRYTLGVLTNGNADIYRLPLGAYFAFAYSAQLLDSSKPMPGHFEKTMARTGAGAGEIVHVGDHPEHDITGAQAHGWRTVWVNLPGLAWPGGKPPDAIVTHIRDLPAAILRIDGDRKTNR